MKLFEDLPSTKTPINAENLNQIQDNLVVVSATEPTGDNREKVWMQKGKNVINLLRCNISNNVSTCKVNSNSIEVSSNGGWAFSQIENYKVDKGREYTLSANYNNNANVNNGIIIYDANGETINYQSSSEMSGRFEITFVPTTEKIKIKFSANNTSNYNTNTVSYTNVQLELGPKATEPEEYIEPKIYVLNDNDIYEEFISKEEKDYQFITNLTVSTTQADIDINLNKYRFIILALDNGTTVKTFILPIPPLAIPGSRTYDDILWCWYPSTKNSLSVKLTETYAYTNLKIYGII